MDERDRRGAYMGGQAKPSAAAATPAAAVPAVEKVPQHVSERLRAIYAEVVAAGKESRALHGRLSTSTESESVRVIAARLETIEKNIKLLV